MYDLGMKILGIETSCDETAASVVEDGKKVLSNVIASQIDLHKLTGGVVPEVAAREHLLKIIPVIDEALKDANCTFDDIDALAVTKGPGLISSLIIGTQAASTISTLKNIPLIPIQHIMGHIYSNWLEVEEKIQFPVLVLTVSGGHNELVLVKGHDDVELIGESRDDAAGEAFDKVARILGLSYPGGPAISKLAEKGDPNAINFPKAYLEKGSLDFSFSGLKTAVLTESKSNPEKADIAASFQEAVVQVLSDKLLMAREKHPEVKEVHLAGGVSANTRLREVCKEKLGSIRFPRQTIFCTDNAAMIAAAGFYMNKSSAKIQNITPSTSFLFFP
ncbi:tRNA (adenosine(37)-N6)-threonylcarbamoyltransferase complex transferase subunit TsaD [Candidatus Peregrinibacteria bacterium]|nr:tRNA (adenosine(37)-N6)-threonylcarbamoyltransferase complex transferase subunit TsaD [Candidatus Peregrinibacteria bacterium]